jgi:hypothetical protein
LFLFHGDEEVEFGARYEIVWKPSSYKARDGWGILEEGRYVVSKELCSKLDTPIEYEDLLLPDLPRESTKGLTSKKARVVEHLKYVSSGLSDNLQASLRSGGLIAHSTSDCVRQEAA